MRSSEAHMDVGRRQVLELAAFVTLAGCTRTHAAAPASLSSSSSSAERATAMRSRELMTLRLSTAPTHNFAAGPRGTRVTYPITGGTFEGDRLRGKVLPGGD